MDTRLLARLLESARAVSPVLPASAAELDLHQHPPSASLRAQVAARLADGTFRVLIDGKALKLALPTDVKAGDVLQLRVTGRDGRLGLSPGISAGLSGKGLSNAGQLIASLASQPPAVLPRQNQPVLDRPPQGSADLPEPLARAVERSGLFYEAHQARWVSGDYPLERLLEEPQATMGRRETVPSQEAIAPADAEPNAPSIHKPLIAAANLPAIDEPALLAPSQSKGRDGKDVETRHDLVAREGLAFVRQQLDTLETRQLAWLGEIWPGQTMRWEIGEQPDSEAEGAPPQVWDSRFEISFPVLGNVGAELALSGSRVRIRLAAQDPETVALMRARARELTDALAGAGVEAVSFEAKQRDPSV